MRHFITAFALLLSLGFCPAEAARTVLTGPLTMYVNGNGAATAVCGINGEHDGAGGHAICAAGDDSKDCLSPANACLTLNNAVQKMYQQYDLATYGFTINLAHGASQNYQLSCGWGALTGNITFNIIGDYTHPTAVNLVVPSGQYGIIAGDFCVPSLSSFEITDSGSAAGGVISTQFGVIDLRSMTFAGNWNGGSVLMAAFNGGRLNLLGADTPNCSLTNTVSSAQVAQVFQVQQNGIANIGGTVDFPNAIAMINNQAFAVGLGGQFGGVNTGTFTGYGVTHATGKKCQMDCTYIQNDLVPNSIFLGNSNCTPYCGY